MCEGEISIESLEGRNNRICASRWTSIGNVKDVFAAIIVVGRGAGQLVSDRRRLYQKGRILGHKRGKRNSRPNQSLVQIDGVDSKEAARSYLGKVSLHTDTRATGRYDGCQWENSWREDQKKSRGKEP